MGVGSKDGSRETTVGDHRIQVGGSSGLALDLGKGGQGRQQDLLMN